MMSQHFLGACLGRNALRIL